MKVIQMGFESSLTNLLPLPCSVWQTVFEGPSLARSRWSTWHQPSSDGWQKRTGPKHPNYSLPTEHWPMIIHRVVEKNEPLRTVAAASGVSHETIRRVVRAARCGSKASV